MDAVSVANSVREAGSLFTTADKQKLVQRVLESEAFRRAPAMRAFLLYITHQAELGQTDQLKEQTIGVEVLGRKAGYEPANDNIVRVRAHELRGRLIRYFATEGINEPVIITIPRGGYAPEFLMRNTLRPDPVPNLEEPPRSSSTSRLGRFWWKAILPCLLVALFVYIVISRYHVTSRSETRTSPSTPAVRDFWTQFFGTHNSVLNVVYADSSIALWQRLSNTDLNLGDYLSRKYLAARNSEELLEIVSQRVTSPADLNTSLRLHAIATDLGGQINSHFARSISAGFLHQGNLVLIGSRRSNPWVEVYEPSLNFQLRLDPKTRSPFFDNRVPQPKELLIYAIPPIEDGKKHIDGKFIERAEEKEFVSYGVVALRKECGTNHLTVLLEGLNEQATQAAGDMVTNPELLGRLLQKIGHVPGSTVSPFEALLQVMSLPGGYDNLQVVAYRLQSIDSCIGN